MNNMMTRKQMIKALTKYELEWAAENPEHLDGIAEFFASGGFDNWTDQSLAEECRDNLWLEVD